MLQADLSFKGRQQTIPKACKKVKRNDIPTIELIPDENTKVETIRLLTLRILMDSSFWFDTINLG